MLVGQHHIDAAWAYVDGVLSGDITAGRRIRLACERHRRDMARATAGHGRWRFDHVKAIKACRFLEDLPHIKGEWASRGERIRLTPWMQFFVCSIFGWVDRETGFRRFRRAYLEVGRKNAKSTILAGISLFCLGLDGEAGAEVYSAAASKDQARIVFNTAKAMALRTPQLEKRAGIQVGAHKITQTHTESIFEPLAAQTRTLDGLNPHCATLDELHAHKSREVFDVIDSGMGARSQPLLLAITTSGYDVGGVCFEQRRDVERMLERVSDVDETDRLFGLVFCADEGDDPGSPETWRKANPNLGVSISEEYIAEQFAKAKRNPAQMGEFKRKHLCIWTSAGVAAFDLDGWARGIRPDLTLAAFKDCERVILSLDGSKSNDFSSLTALGYRGRDLLLWSEHWATQDVIDAPGNEHLQGWVAEGWLNACPGALIDQAAFRARIDAIANEIAPEEIAYDPQYLLGMAQALSAEGYLMVEQRQNTLSLDPGFRQAQGLVREARVLHRGDPVMTWMVSNTVAQASRSGDLIHPAKIAPQEKIDGVQAWLTGMARFDAPPEAPERAPEYQMIVL